MSEYNNPEENNTPVAQLQDGEAVIPHPLVDKYEEAIAELNLNNDIKISKPKEIPETDENNVIGSAGTNRPGGERKPALTPNQDGILSSARVDRVAASSPKSVVKEKPETTAVFSTKNVTWQGVGKVYRGYNIVTKESAEKWLTRGHIRLATPEEIKQEFNK
jgi:hypothetical protein